MLHFIDEGTEGGVQYVTVLDSDSNPLVYVMAKAEAQHALDMGDIGIPDGVDPIRCQHGVNEWPGHECGKCDA